MRPLLSRSPPKGTLFAPVACKAGVAAVMFLHTCWVCAAFVILSMISGGGGAVAAAAADRTEGSIRVLE